MEYIERFKKICNNNSTSFEEVREFVVFVEDVVKDPIRTSVMSKLNILYTLIQEGAEINPDLPAILESWE